MKLDTWVLMMQYDIENVVSLFDGISVGQLALLKAHIRFKNYFASEIHKDSIKVTQHHHPNTIQLGDVRGVKGQDLPKIDLLIGGSPCQSFSFSGDMTGFDGKSGLFYQYVRILEETKPKYFFLENVVMKTQWKDHITSILGVEPIRICSSLVSCQTRGRLYWTNIPGIDIPKDRNILFKDNVSKQYDESLVLKGTQLNKLKRPRIRIITTESLKIPCIMKAMHKKPSDSIIIKDKDIYRYPTIEEMEIAQTLPIGYTKILNSWCKSAHVIGDSWTVDVIAHIFKNIKDGKEEFKLW